MESQEQIYDGRDSKFTGDGVDVEGRRGGLVRSGRCSGQSWCRGRRRQRSSEAARREEEEAKGHEGEKEMTLRSYL